MSIVEGKCPNCGAPIKVDTDSEASYCEYCSTPFITEKAIVKGDYIAGNKIVNNVKQDNEYSAKKFKSIQNIVMILIVLVIWIIGMAFAYFTGA